MSAVARRVICHRLYDACCSALMRHEARVQRLENHVDARTQEDAKAQVIVRRPSCVKRCCFLTLRFQATLHRVLRHLVLHRQRLAAIEEELERDRAAAATAEGKLGQALSVQPTIDMSYKQTKMQQHQLASTIANFTPQVRLLGLFCILLCSCGQHALACVCFLTPRVRRVRSMPQHSQLQWRLRMSLKVT